MNNDEVKKAIRYILLSDWVKQATEEEILDKLIQLDELRKEVVRLRKEKESDK